MYAFILQDWITIAGPDINTIIQGESDWLDMSPYQDVCAWFDLTENSVSSAGSLQLQFETAPSKDERLFQAMAPVTSITTGTTGLTVVQMLMGSATVPVAQFLRWKIGPSTNGAWNCTFRILVAANAPGLQLTDTNTPFLLPPEM